jgi:hypothetical protein
VTHTLVAQVAQHELVGRARGNSTPQVDAAHPRSSDLRRRQVGADKTARAATSVRRMARILVRRRAARALKCATAWFHSAAIGESIECSVIARRELRPF